ncbi:MAG: glucuronate isomerase, partial [Bryobacteraceae bacterium]
MSGLLMSLIHEDRLFPSDPETRAVARRLYQQIAALPIISPHGHTEARWFAQNAPFPNPTELLIIPDHYIFRMLYSQGVLLESLGIRQTNINDPRGIWRIFAAHYYLFRGTPTRLWLDYSFQELFGLGERLSAKNADHYYDVISDKLASPEFLPRALYERFKIEVLATTDSPLDSLEHHEAIRKSGWKARIIPTFRPDSVVDPDFPNFRSNVQKLGEMHGEDTSEWHGYLAALRKARERFRKLGCTATDHGHPTARTANLSGRGTADLFGRILDGSAEGEQRELFRA